MSTIGVGRAFRDQDREARRRRERARHTFELVRSHRTTEDLELTGSEVCADCGERVEASEVLWTEGGPLCEGCVLRVVEGEPAPVEAPGVSLFTVCAVMVVAVHGAVAFGTGTWQLLSGKGGVGWPLFSAMSVVAGLLALVDGLSRRGHPLVAVHRGLGAALLVVALVSSLRPYLG